MSNLEKYYAEKMKLDVKKILKYTNDIMSDDISKRYIYYL